MPRARNIKPAFFKNEDVVELPFESRLLFIGLWTLADREGRLEDRPKRIKMELFPADTVDVDKCLGELAELGLINRYEVDSRQYIEIPKFSKHQNPHHKEAKSEIPAPSKPSKSSKAPDKPEASPSQAPSKGSADPADSLIPDSLLLIPDSLIPDCLALQGLHAPPQIDIQAPHPDHAKPALAVLTTPPFDRFWQAYPRKTNKHEAKKAFAKTNANVDELITDVQQRLACGHWSTREKNFIPHASTYLNQRRWEDEIVTRETPMDSQSVATRTDALLREIDSGGFQ